MGDDPLFLDQLEIDLRRAYARHARRRRRRRVALVVCSLAFVAVATASAVTGALDGFTIAQDREAHIVGSPPRLIACGTDGCVRAGTRGSPDGRRLYVFSHRLGDDLPTSGHIAESFPGQAVFDDNGNELKPPSGAELAFICTSIDADRLDCSPLATADDTLPRGAAIYILSTSEYVTSSMTKSSP